MPPASADPPRDRPFLVLMTSHWLSFLGMGLVATALISWLFVLPLHVRGHVDNPYIGVLVFMVIPIILVAGLVMVPVGVLLARKRARQRLTEQIVDRKAAIRRMAWFLGIVTVANVIVGTQATYRAVEHMESVQFCGQTCHVMTPEMRAHAVSPHARVQCVECHVGEGARGWLESKMSGTRQLIEVVFNSHPRPIPSAIETDKLVPSRETCERCHWPEKFVSARLKVIPKFAAGRGQHAEPDRSHDDGRGEPDARHPRLALRPGRRDPIRRRRQEAAEDPVGGIPQHQERGDALLPCQGRRRGGGQRSPALHDAVRGLPQPADPRLRAAGPGHGQGDDGRPAARDSSVLEEEGGGAAQGQVREQRRGGPAHPGRARGLLPAGLPESGLRTRGRCGRGREDARPHLRQQCLPGPGSHLGPLSEQPGPRRVSRLLPLPRRRAQDRRRKDDHPGLRRVPRSRGHGGELSGSAQDPGARREDPGPPESRSAARDSAKALAGAETG